MFAASQQGDKNFDMKEAAKNLPQSNLGDLGEGVGGGPLEGAPGDVQEDTENRARYGSAGFEYNVEQSGILTDTNNEDFDDFGKL